MGAFDGAGGPYNRRLRLFVVGCEGRSRPRNAQEAHQAPSLFQEGCNPT